MDACAAIADVKTELFRDDFPAHKWAVKNLKGEFSTVWPKGVDHDLLEYNEAVYFYGGRGAIYTALSKYQHLSIVNAIRDPPYRNYGIHVFRREVEVGGGKTKQIIMLAIADPTREEWLKDDRDSELELRGGRAVRYKMEAFRELMKKKWPKDIG